MLAYLKPASEGFTIQIIVGILISAVILGLIIFFICWIIKKIKKMSKQVEEIHNDKTTDEAQSE